MKKPFLFLALASLFSCNSEAVVTAPIAAAAPSSVFPLSGGTDLSGAQRQFPRDFTAKKTIVVIAYQRWQQDEVDAWFQALEAQIRNDPDLEYFELPTISPMGSFREWVIYKGMQSGITDPWMRQRVVTLHLDKSAFNRALQIPDEKHVSIFVIAAGGRILGKVNGPCHDNLLLQVKALVQGGS